MVLNAHSYHVFGIWGKTLARLQCWHEDTVACGWSKLQYFCRNPIAVDYICFIVEMLNTALILICTHNQEHLHTSHMIMCNISPLVRTATGAHIYLTNHCHDNNSMRESWSWECLLCDVRFMWLVQYELPFSLHHSCTAKYNKWLIRWRNWEHVTMRAWERFRAGTPAWPSSDSSLGNKGLAAFQ